MRHRRIIPARAGFTKADLHRASASQDHPRSRGVYAGTGIASRYFPGSSPLARGLQRGNHNEREGRRIIPARAGFTRGREVPGRDPGDHPRSRGVYTVPCRATPSPSGSSPLARGLHDRRVLLPGPLGIIPARAGFTSPSWRSSPENRDHPRSRGVYWSPGSRPTCSRGSSPLARGLRARRARRGST